MPQSYSIALKDAREELDQAISQKKSLDLRVAQLEAVIAQLQALVDSSPAPASKPLFEPPARVQATGSPTPLWKAIVDSLNGFKGNFTVPIAVKSLERTGRHIESKNRLNIVRNTLKQREDIFGRHEPEKFGQGHYFVKGFENEKGGHVSSLP
jgi:hypothetical protein